MRIPQAAATSMLEYISCFQEEEIEERGGEGALKVNAGATTPTCGDSAGYMGLEADAVSALELVESVPEREQSRLQTPRRDSSKIRNSRVETNSN